MCTGIHEAIVLAKEVKDCPTQSEAEFCSLVSQWVSIQAADSSWASKLCGIRASYEHSIL